MKQTTITVVANPGCTVPIPAGALRAATGVQVKILPAGAEPRHRHELAGKVTLDLSSPEVAQYVRRRIAAGDLTAVEPDPPAPAPVPSSSSSATSTPAAAAAAPIAKD